MVLRFRYIRTLGITIAAATSANGSRAPIAMIITEMDPVKAQPAAKKILFVCSGNLCRSFMAERVFRKLSRQAGRAGIQAASAGLLDLGGVDADPQAAAILHLHPVGGAGGAARQLDDFTHLDGFAKPPRNQRLKGRLSLFRRIKHGIIPN